MTTSHEELLQAIGRLDGQIGSMGKSVASLSQRMQAVEAIANQGKGALWMFLKVGGFIALVFAAGAWVWSQVHPS